MSQNCSFRLVGPAALTLLIAASAFGGTNPYLDRLPLRFEANTGQTDKQVRFYTKSSDYTLFLTGRESVLAAGKRTLRMSLRGGNPEPLVEGVNKLRSRSDYFLGNRPDRWTKGVPHYSRVAYRNVYPGIDLLYYGLERRVEHDFIVSPGSVPSRIHMQFSGADKMSLDAAGDLVMTLGREQVRQLKPVAYQEIGGERNSVEVSYRLLGKNEVGFSVGRYDASQPLVIDPVLVYSSYIGGSKTDVATAVAVDGDGYMWVAGYTYSVDFPITEANTIEDEEDDDENSGRDVFVAKFDPKLSGEDSLVYSTFLGGSADEEPSAIVAKDGFIYLCGTTYSSDMPWGGNAHDTDNNGSRDTFVYKLYPGDTGDNALWYGSTVGGAENEWAYGLAVDDAGKIYVTGTTVSETFPTTDNAYQTVNAIDDDEDTTYDAFLYVIDPSITDTTKDSLVYSTYLGGTSTDIATSVAIDAAGKAYITGYTLSSNFPISAEAYQTAAKGNGDIFIVRMDVSKTGTAALDYSTLFGASKFEMPYGIAIDAAGFVYVTGYTLSEDFPLTASSYQDSLKGTSDIFVSKFDFSALPGTLVYSSLFGGSNVDVPYAIALDETGRVFVTGYTYSADFPIAGEPIQSAKSSLSDAFAAVIDTSLSGTDALVWSSYFGGSSMDMGYGIAVDDADALYVAGYTKSKNLIVTDNAHKGWSDDFINGFFFKFDLKSGSSSTAEGSGEETNPASVTLLKSKN
ncbi:MAG: SBBP repeat-containing protein [Bryobacteraceae bacterium]